MDSGVAPPGFTHHRLPAAFLSTLSTGEGSPAITGYLWSIERSRRILLIDTFLREACSRPELLGPLPSPAGAWDTLGRAQRSGPAEVDAVVRHPEVGSWVAYALRRYRGGASSNRPLWIDFGGIHALTLVAAARAGIAWTTRVPARDGHVMLPSLGMARFPGIATDDTIAGQTEGGRIWLSDGDREMVVSIADMQDVERADGAGWWTLRRVRAGGAGRLYLTAWLNDLDPFRDLADPVAPARLDATAFARWQALINDAWGLLCRDHRDEALAMAGGVVSLVPLQDDPDWGTRSASSGEAFGSVMMSEPPDAVTFAVTLVHEYQHIALGGLLHLVALTGADDEPLYYAPWRDDPRPLSGLLQGIYAFIGIARFFRYRCQRIDGPDGALATFEYVYARAQTAEAVETLLSEPALTATGRSFVEGLRAQIGTWTADPIDPEIARLAALTADIHRAGWRLRNWQPASGDVAELVRAWASGQPIRIHPPAVRRHPQMRWEQRIPVIARRWARSIGADSPRAADGLDAAENALVAGDIESARSGFLTSVASVASGVAPSTEEVRAWAGLAVAGHAEGGSASWALYERVDLVRALYGELRASDGAADPLAIAAWIESASVS